MTTASSATKPKEILIHYFFLTDVQEIFVPCIICDRYKLFRFSREFWGYAHTDEVLAELAMNNFCSLLVVNYTP